VFGSLPEDLRQQVSVREQLAFAYNRRAEATADRGDRATALEILEALRQEQGPTSETSGMIGRIHKSQWLEASAAGELGRARGHLKRAVAAYVEGFEADWREVYPGINAVTLLDVQGGRAAAEQKQRLLPVVRFAVEQRLSGQPDYWDHATRLEIAVLDDDDELALDVLDEALSAVTERWQPKSTAGNLRIIEQARRARGEEVVLLNHLISALHSAAGEPSSSADGVES
jgi:MAP3K TRAFs-binding domain